MIVYVALVYGVSCGLLHFLRRYISRNKPENLMETYIDYQLNKKYFTKVFNVLNR
jgi:hypothetical protein